MPDGIVIAKEKEKGRTGGAKTLMFYVLRYMPRSS